MGGLTGCSIGDPAKLQDLECIFANVIAAVLFLAGIVLFIMLIIGGFKWLTSGGDPKAVDGARGTITSATLGLVVLILAYIVLLIIGQVVGVDLRKFRITQ